MMNPTYSAFITIVNDNSYYLPITMRTCCAHNAENQETAGHLEQEKMTDPIEDQRQSFNRWLERTGQSTLAVAKRAGINESALRHYKNGKTRDLRMENKLKIAQTQHAKLSDIFGETAQRFSSPPPASIAASSGVPSAEPPMFGGAVPVVGRAQNGRVIATIFPIAYVEAPQNMTLSGNVYAVRVANTLNMPRLRMRETVLCSPDDPVAPGDDAAIHDTDGEIHLMRCLENSHEHGFTGTIYSNEGKKITIPADAIVNVARIVAIYPA
jgi:hypothetical protein